jgi:arylformamidase
MKIWTLPLDKGMEKKPKIIDISVPIKPGMVHFPGDPGFEMSPYFSRLKGDPVNLSVFTMGSHTGTHVDLPRHLFDKAPVLRDLDLEHLIGPAYVASLSGVSNLITGKDLEKLPSALPRRILLKTKNSERGYMGRKKFLKDYVSLGLDAARYLVKRGVKVIGIDYLSIDGFEMKELAVHKYLLKNRVVIIEGLDLRGVKPGVYFLICLPLNIPSAEGSPARAILMSDA